MVPSIHPPDTPTPTLLNCLEFLGPRKKVVGISDTHMNFWLLSAIVMFGDGCGWSSVVGGCWQVMDGKVLILVELRRQVQHRFVVFR